MVGIFAEDATVPVAAIDVVLPLILPASDAASASSAQQPDALRVNAFAWALSCASRPHAYESKPHGSRSTTYCSHPP